MSFKKSSKTSPELLKNRASGSHLKTSVATETRSLSSFWTGRLEKFGHTGWADKIIYTFDQPVRLEIIGEIISSLGVRNGVALDFGCGIGDFSKLLLSKGFKVCGYDPFVQPKILTDGFDYASAYNEIPYGEESFDLVLTVTTLAHILTEAALKVALTEIGSRTKRSGNLYFTEYALDSESDRSKDAFKSDYQVFRTVAEWEEVFNGCSLQHFPYPSPL